MELVYVPARLTLAKACASSRELPLSAPKSPLSKTLILVLSFSVRALARSSIPLNSSFVSGTLTRISSIISHTGGAASTATFIASMASLSTSVFDLDVAKSMEGFLNPSDGEDEDDASRELCDPCREWESHRSGCTGGDRMYDPVGVCPLDLVGVGAPLGRRATRRVGVDEGSTTPAEYCGDSTYDGNSFPISTSFKLKDPACRRDIRIPVPVLPELERMRDPVCPCEYPNGMVGTGGADAGTGVDEDLSNTAGRIVVEEYAFTGGGRWS